MIVLKSLGSTALEEYLLFLLGFSFSWTLCMHVQQSSLQKVERYRRPMGWPHSPFDSWQEQSHWSQADLHLNPGSANSKHVTLDVLFNVSVQWHWLSLYQKCRAKRGIRFIHALCLAQGRHVVNGCHSYFHDCCGQSDEIDRWLETSSSESCRRSSLR